MKLDINSDSIYWASFNRFELRLPGECVLDCSGSGSADEAVAYWVPKVRALVESDDFANKPTDEKIRVELAEYGAWDGEELSDAEQNWHRLVWIAACNVAEEDAPDCSEPMKPIVNRCPSCGKPDKPSGKLCSSCGQFVDFPRPVTA